MYNAVNSFMIALALVHFSKKKKKRKESNTILPPADTI